MAIETLRCEYPPKPHNWKRESTRGRKPRFCTNPKHKPAPIVKAPAPKSEPGKPTKLHCELGNHDWIREPKRGRVPANCPEHKPTVNAPKANGKVTLHCALGNHDWERESKRGRAPVNCPEHSKAPIILRDALPLLHCEIGNHDWTRPAARGRKPSNCPQHAPVKEMRDPSAPPKPRGRPRIYATPEEQAEAQLARSRERAANLEASLKERGTHLSQQDPYRLMKLVSVTGKGKKTQLNYEFVSEHSPLAKAQFVSAHAAEFDNQQYRYERHGKVVQFV